MNFLWPISMVLLGVIPLLTGLYIWGLRRRRRFAVRFSSLALVRDALPRYSRWRRHLPFALFLVAALSLVIGIGRPTAVLSVPANQTVIILAFDVSSGMGFPDVHPSRLGAAQLAALSFIQHQRPTALIGIVAFTSTAQLVLPPTSDSQALQAAVESLTTGRRTAIGSGILKALDAIAQVDDTVAPSVSDPSSGIAPTPVPKGVYAPDVVVLLTDGDSDVGIPPLDAAQQAADRGVRIYAIGYSGNSFGGYGGGIRESTMKQIADMTGGKYYAATNAGELQSVFDNLPTNLITRAEISEVSVVFAAIGALVATLAIALSLMWQPLP